LGTESPILQPAGVAMYLHLRSSLSSHIPRRGYSTNKKPDLTLSECAHECLRKSHYPQNIFDYPMQIVQHERKN